MTVFDLRSVGNHFVLKEMQKVTSAYTKSSNPVGFVRSSQIMYTDKKRTTSLLRSIGFQMPIELHQSGFTGSIAYRGRSVNLYGTYFDASDLYDIARDEVIARQAETMLTNTDAAKSVSEQLKAEKSRELVCQRHARRCRSKGWGHTTL